MFLFFSRAEGFSQFQLAGSLESGGFAKTQTPFRPGTVALPPSKPRGHDGGRALRSGGHSSSSGILEASTHLLQFRAFEIEDMGGSPEGLPRFCRGQRLLSHKILDTV